MVSFPYGKDLRPSGPEPCWCIHESLADHIQRMSGCTHQGSSWTSEARLHLHFRSTSRWWASRTPYRVCLPCQVGLTCPPFWGQRWNCTFRRGRIMSIQRSCSGIGDSSSWSMCFPGSKDQPTHRWHCWPFASSPRHRFRLLFSLRKWACGSARPFSGTIHRSSERVCTYIRLLARFVGCRIRNHRSWSCPARYTYTRRM